MHTVRVGDMIECVHNIHREQHLTIGKHYSVHATYNGYSKRHGRVDVLDDSGNFFNCGHWRFVPVIQLASNPSVIIKKKTKSDIIDSEPEEIDFLEILRGY